MQGMYEMNKTDIARYFGDSYTADMRYCLCPDEPSIRRSWDAYQESRETSDDQS
jgi:hypothetical protein